MMVALWLVMPRERHLTVAATNLTASGPRRKALDMQLGLIGLGRMGGNMRERLRAAGHEVIGYDRNPYVSDVPSLEAMVEGLDAPRVVWVMVPSGDPTRDTVARLADVL